MLFAEDKKMCESVNYRRQLFQEIIMFDESTFSGRMSMFLGNRIHLTFYLFFGTCGIGIVLGCSPRCVIIVRT